MIHLVGIVFQGGLGVPLYTDQTFFKNQPTEMIWALATAMQSFAQSVLGEDAKGTSELKSGNLRVVLYDPFYDLEDLSGYTNIDYYVIMALQDLYDNLEITTGKLREVHKIILPLGLDKPNSSIGFSVPADIIKEIQHNIEKTQFFPDEKIKEVHSIINKFLLNKNIISLVVSIADIDGGLITSLSTKYLYEDPEFTELILSNLVAENPSDSKTIWIERKAPGWVINPESTSNEQLLEAFILEHIGKRSDFRLLARVCFDQADRELVRQEIQLLANNLYSLLS